MTIIIIISVVISTCSITNPQPPSHVVCSPLFIRAAKSVHRSTPWPTLALRLRLRLLLVLARLDEVPRGPLFSGVTSGPVESEALGEEGHVGVVGGGGQRGEGGHQLVGVFTELVPELRDRGLVLGALHHRSHVRRRFL